MHIEPRNGASIDRIYLHKNEGPPVEGGAVGLGHYLDTIDGGYHKIVDDKVTVVKASDDQVVWGEGGDNEHCLAICDVGWSSETAAMYVTDPYTIAEFERTAQEVAAWCKLYNIPPVHVAPGAPGQPPTERGIAEHADDHSPFSAGHTDPGAAYPIGTLCQRVQQILTPIDWAALAKLAAWEKAVAANPLEYQQTRPEVIILKELLTQRGYHVNPGPFYGMFVSRAVAQFKAKAQLTNRIGEIVGADCAHALLSLPL